MIVIYYKLFMLSELDTAQDSFDELHKWVRDINENVNTSQNVPLTLLGNKCDLKKEDDDHFLKAKVTSKVSVTIGQLSYH